MVIAVASLLRIVAVLSCAIVLIGFLSFANDEASAGSDKQIEAVQRAMDDPAPAPSAERAREKKHGEVRELIDDANDFLLEPFSGVVASDDSWVKRIVPTVLALLAYGLGLTLLANFLPRRKPTATGDWRTAG